MLHNEVKIFNLLFRGGDIIVKSHSLDTDSHRLSDFSKALQQTFADVYLAIVARISESDDI